MQRPRETPRDPAREHTRRRERPPAREDAAPLAEKAATEASVPQAAVEAPTNTRHTVAIVTRGNILHGRLNISCTDAMPRYTSLPENIVENIVQPLLRSHANVNLAVTYSLPKRCGEANFKIYEEGWRQAVASLEQEATAGGASFSLKHVKFFPNFMKSQHDSMVRLAMWLNDTQGGLSLLEKVDSVLFIRNDIAYPTSAEKWTNLQSLHEPSKKLYVASGCEKKMYAPNRLKQECVNDILWWMPAKQYVGAFIKLIKHPVRGHCCFCVGPDKSAHMECIAGFRRELGPENFQWAKLWDWIPLLRTREDSQWAEFISTSLTWK